MGLDAIVRRKALLSFLGNLDVFGDFGVQGLTIFVDIPVGTGVSSVHP
jgi:hypothetical protein